MNKFRWFSLMLVTMFSMSSISAQEPESNVLISLERTICFGTCPVYAIHILEDGTVIYNGEDFVDVHGEQTTELPIETVTSMVDAFYRAGYFDWEESYYIQTVSDLPTVITSVTRNGITHRIARYAGDYNAPLALPFLEQWIDVMTNSHLWTGIESDITTISNGTNTPILSLQQGPSFGPGPVYNIAAYEDGTIVYMGIANVDEIGIKISKTDPSSITNIAEIAEISGYFNWQEAYEERLITDQATITTAVQWNEQSKRIVRYNGDPNAPIGIVRIEEAINNLIAQDV